MKHSLHTDCAHAPCRLTDTIKSKARGSQNSAPGPSDRVPRCSASTMSGLPSKTRPTSWPGISLRVLQRGRWVQRRVTRG
jgi:hypothetical protein